MYDTILIPTDGSDVAERAIGDALELAVRFDASIHALYVVDVDAIDLSFDAEHVDRIKSDRFGELDELEERAREATGRVVARGEDRGMTVTEAIGAGQASRVIADYAADHGVDLIVMGSHGRSGVRRALLGSVTERVLRSAHVPVLVVTARREEIA